MRVRYLTLLFSFVLATLANVVGADERVIELVDGSRIHGEVVGMNGESWIIESASLGRIEIDSQRIRSVKAADASAAHGAVPAPDPTGSPSVNAISSTMASNPGLMARIMTLRDDPQVQAVLTDPDVMAAVRRLDFEALRNNPKFQALMNDPKVKSITSSVE